MGAELRAVNQVDGLRERFERQRPVHGRISTPDDHDVLVAKILDMLGEVMNALSFELNNTCCAQPGWLKGADSCRDNDRSAPAGPFGGVEHERSIVHRLE